MAFEISQWGQKIHKYVSFFLCEIACHSIHSERQEEYNSHDMKKKAAKLLKGIQIKGDQIWAHIDFSIMTTAAYFHIQCNLSGIFLWWQTHSSPHFSFWQSLSSSVMKTLHRTRFHCLGLFPHSSTAFAGQKILD